MSHRARRIATQVTEPKLEASRIIANNLLKDIEFEDAHDLIRQAVRTLEDAFDGWYARFSWWSERAGFANLHRTISGVSA